ncbi:hypothetical protein [Rahnella selenatireducens]|uniref:hypothetical protein n=1 Tax=Rahnella selenatireducens TaxID=3389797 RepID=UPI003969466C
MKNFMKLVSLVLILMTPGCCSLMDRHVDLYPENPPVARVGNPYYVRIITKGSPVRRLHVINIEGFSDSGMNIRAYVDNSMYGFIEITGTPNKVGIISFEVEGSTPGTQCPGLQFRKNFNLLVVDPESKSKSKSKSKMQSASLLKNESLVIKCL